MTDDPVVLLREAADKATPGPWRRLGTGVYSDSGHRVVADMHNTTGKPDERSYDDADCVATIRNHLDAVLAEVVRLRAQVEAVRDAYAWLRERAEYAGAHGGIPNGYAAAADELGRALGGSDE